MDLYKALNNRKQENLEGFLSHAQMKKRITWWNNNMSPNPQTPNEVNKYINNRNQYEGKFRGIKIN